MKKKGDYIKIIKGGGVCWNKNDNIWTSNITINNKRTHLGSFKTELEAYQVRCNFEKENGIINKYL